MTRQYMIFCVIATLFFCAVALLGVPGTAESKVLYQTIPGMVYLPVVIKQEPPTPTLTSTATFAPTATATQAATPMPTITPTATSRPNCDASYPTVCIPPPPPDLDCKNIPYRRFKVLQPDPHNFDTDHDGIGCES